MKPSILALALIATSLIPTHAAQAAKKDLDLACIADANTRSGFMVRQIIVGEEHANVVLEDSRGHKIKAKKYAVVIEIVAGGREEWEILSNEEFRIKEVAPQEYKVSDLKNRIEFTCSPNHTVRANPALTRTN